MLIRPPDETGHSPLKGYLLPFEPKIHKRLIVKEFSDVQENLNLNNIQDNDPLAQGVPVQGLNPINTNQNWLNLLMGSLMPWNDLPGQNGQNFQAQDEEDFEED